MGVAFVRFLPLRCGADDRLIEAVDQIIRLPETKALTREPRQSIECREMAADSAGAAIAVLAAIGQMEIPITGAFAFQRHEGELPPAVYIRHAEADIAEL